VSNLKSYSFWGFVGITILYAFLFLNNREWTREDALRHDMTSYYAYLPAVFVEQDIALSDPKPRKQEFYWWTVEAPAKQGRVIRMTMGVGYLHLPFFLIAHSTAEFFGFDADGFNSYYFFWIVFGSLFYCLCGLWMLRRLLLHFFDDKVVLLALLLIACATNLLYYTIYEGPMSHAYNFFLINCLLWLTIKWHQQPKWQTTVLLGLIAGTITLTRPTNLWLMVVPVLYNVYSLESFKQKLALVGKYWYYIPLAAFCAFIVGFPQLLYWKYLSGKWLFYTYNDEIFYFNNPHIFYGLFSYRKGWLLYTPAMLLALGGIVFFAKKYLKQWAWALYLFLPVYIYIVYSWWTWWYGGGFGSRPMIDIYGLLALPLAALITWAIKKRWSRATFLVVGAFFIYLNAFQTWQYKKALIHWDSMTKEAYHAIFFKKHYPDGYDKMIKNPDYEKAKKGEEEY
jgi:hypothetical protein